jgi:hypothetical protein
MDIAVLVLSFLALSLLTFLYIDFMKVVKNFGTLKDIEYQLEELNENIARYMDIIRTKRDKYPVTLEPGVYYPSEDDMVDALNIDLENREHALTNPYRSWEVFDGEEETG